MTDVTVNIIVKPLRVRFVFVLVLVLGCYIFGRNANYPL